MPQLMPMFWNMSLFMMMFILIMLIIMFNSMKIYKLNMKNFEIKVYKIWKW